MLCGPWAGSAPECRGRACEKAVPHCPRTVPHCPTEVNRRILSSHYQRSHIRVRCSTWSIWDHGVKRNSRPSERKMIRAMAVLAFKSSHEANLIGPRYGRCERALYGATKSHTTAAKGRTAHSTMPRRNKNV